MPTITIERAIEKTGLTQDAFIQILSNLIKTNNFGPESDTYQAREYLLAKLVEKSYMPEKQAV